LTVGVGLFVTLGIRTGNRWVGHAQWRLVQRQHTDSAASEGQSHRELALVVTRAVGLCSVAIMITIYRTVVVVVTGDH